MQPIYLHNLSPQMSLQPIKSRVYQWLLYLLTNQIMHKGFWIFNKLNYHLTLKMAQVTEMSVNNNSQDSNHPDDLFNKGILLCWCIQDNHYFWLNLEPSLST